MLTVMYQRSRDLPAWPDVTLSGPQTAEYEAVAVFCVLADGLVPTPAAWPAVHASYEEWRKRKNSADELAKVGVRVLYQCLPDSNLVLTLYIPVTRLEGSNGPCVHQDAHELQLVNCLCRALHVKAPLLPMALLQVGNVFLT
jgi:hypothetical protein